MPLPNDTYYGAYRTRTFGEIFPTQSDFSTFYTTCGYPQTLITTTGYTNYGISTIYALLATRYCNSHIKSSDEGAFKMRVMKIIFSAGKEWQRLRYIQDKYIGMTDAEMINGDERINNHAANPSTAPITSSRTALGYIDEQNVSLYQKDPIVAYSAVTDRLDSEIDERFLDKFRNLFIDITYPDNMLLYEEVQK